jgi:hypothetical protein
MPLDEFDDVPLPISDRSTHFDVRAPSAILALALNRAIRFLAYFRVLLFRQKDVVEVAHIVPVPSWRRKAPYDVEQSTVGLKSVS